MLNLSLIPWPSLVPPEFLLHWFWPPTANFMPPPCLLQRHRFAFQPSATRWLVKAGMIPFFKCVSLCGGRGVWFSLCVCVRVYMCVHMHACVCVCGRVTTYVHVPAFMWASWGDVGANISRWGVGWQNRFWQGPRSPSLVEKNTGTKSLLLVRLATCVPLSNISWTEEFQPILH